MILSSFRIKRKDFSKANMRYKNV